jgi:hypothetical protein
MKLKPKFPYIPILILFLGVLLIWLFSFVFVNQQCENRTFQDVFTILNTLFSGLALAGVILAILLQKAELELQRQELMQTSNEFVIQNETLKKQRFENTFFQLLNLHHEIIDKLAHHSAEGDRYEKREVFTQAIKRFDTELDNAIEYQIRKETEFAAIGGETLPPDFFIITGYTDFFSEYQSSLSHYFRNIYHAFKYVFTTKLLPDDEKKFYTSIIRAQLSPDELHLLFYNSLVPKLGYPKFLFLIKEFDILKNFDTDIIPKKAIEIFEKKKSEVKNPF